MNTTFTELTNLKKNWNGYGAEPIDISIINRAKEFYENISIKPNFMSPTAKGTIQFEFPFTTCYVEVEIYKNHFELYLTNNGSFEGTFSYTTNDYLKIEKIINFFTTL